MKEGSACCRRPRSSSLAAPAKGKASCPSQTQQREDRGTTTQGGGGEGREEQRDDDTRATRSRSSSTTVAQEASASHTPLLPKKRREAGDAEELGSSDGEGGGERDGSSRQWRQQQQQKRATAVSSASFDVRLLEGSDGSWLDEYDDKYDDDEVQLFPWGAASSDIGDGDIIRGRSGAATTGKEHQSLVHDEDRLLDEVASMMMPLDEPFATTAKTGTGTGTPPTGPAPPLSGTADTTARRGTTASPSSMTNAEGMKRRSAPAAATDSLPADAEAASVAQLSAKQQHEANERAMAALQVPNSLSRAPAASTVEGVRKRGAHPPGGRAPLTAPTSKVARAAKSRSDSRLESGSGPAKKRRLATSTTNKTAKKSCGNGNASTKPASSGAAGKKKTDPSSGKVAVAPPGEQAQVVGPGSEQMKTTMRMIECIRDRFRGDAGMLDKLRQILNYCTERHHSGDAPYRHLPGAILEHLVDVVDGGYLAQVYQQAKSMNPNGKIIVPSASESIAPGHFCAAAAGPVPTSHSDQQENADSAATAAAAAAATAKEAPGSSLETASAASDLSSNGNAVAATSVGTNPVAAMAGGPSQPAAAVVAPNLLQIAVAYGYHLGRNNLPNIPNATAHELAQQGAETVWRMSPEERCLLWRYIAAETPGPVAAGAMTEGEARGEKMEEEDADPLCLL